MLQRQNVNTKNSLFQILFLPISFDDKFFINLFVYRNNIPRIFRSPNLSNTILDKKILALVSKYLITIVLSRIELFVEFRPTLEQRTCNVFRDGRRNISFVERSWPSLV